MSKSKKLGVIVEVDGTISKVGMYSETNDSEYIWNGDILTGPKVGAYLTINQNDVKIIATVSSEKITDEKNSTLSSEYINTFSKDTINRIVTLKVKGVIKNQVFEQTSKYTPMIGNSVTLTTKEELSIVYGLGNNEEAIEIGTSILEGYPIRIPINRFFASHIGIFGNTGSGKSNTLHKCYLELFKTKYAKTMVNKSQFFVIDFNGEYSNENQFGIGNQNKKVININTHNPNIGDKLPVKKEYIFDPDILAILFDARPATQVPFLRNALKTFKGIEDESQFARLEIGLLKRLILEHRSVSSDSIENWISAAKNMGINSDYLEKVKLAYHIEYGNLKVYDIINGKTIVKDEQFTEDGISELGLDFIEQDMKTLYLNATPINKLDFFLGFQRVFVSAWKSTNLEHINPLFKRIESAINSLDKVIEVKDEIDSEYAMLNIISLLNANQEITRLVPMLLSKMIYDEQKKYVSIGRYVRKTKHLIIDEAHNILNEQHKRNGDDWQDYRLSVFEEIIKEGRKFGFYLTLASQRPADISQTIMSQLHNYIIHRLVNEKDLNMLGSTMPTLDKFSYDMIPLLGQGEAVLTGSSIKVPILVKVNKEEMNRPQSDDVDLVMLWAN